MVTAVRRLFILFHAGLMWTVSKADASFCTKDQISRCKAAAVDSDLDGLPEGGICKRNKYVEYTHECVVSNDLTSGDYCCCTFEQRVLCCRFHYIAGYFRCDEDEDTIHYLTSEPLALEILVPAIVVPSVAFLCFVFYCIRCCCCNDDDDDDDRGGCCYIRSRCCRKRRRRREKSPPIRTENHYASVAPDNQRSILLPQTTKDHTSSVVPEKCDKLFAYKTSMEAGTRTPTAPPAPPYEVAAGLDPHPPPYNPDLYDPTVLNSHVNYAPMPYISCQNENGHSVIYQPILTHAQIPLPVTKLTENAHAQTTDNENSDNEDTVTDNR